MALLDICDSMIRMQEAIAATPTRQLYELLKVHALAVTATLLERDGAADLVVKALNDATEKARRLRIA